MIEGGGKRTKECERNKRTCSKLFLTFMNVLQNPFISLNERRKELNMREIKIT